MRRHDACHHAKVAKAQQRGQHSTHAVSAHKHPRHGMTARRTLDQDQERPQISVQGSTRAIACFTAL